MTVGNHTFATPQPTKANRRSLSLRAVGVRPGRFASPKPVNYLAFCVIVQEA